MSDHDYNGELGHIRRMNMGITCDDNTVEPL